MFIFDGCDFRKPLIINRANKNPIARPIIGDITIKSTTFSTPEAFTELMPAAAIPAPISPPTSAWLLEVGRPIYQVIRSHITAPERAAKIRFTVTIFVSMIPVPIIAAIAVPKTRGPTRLKTAAIVTAFNGESTFVATTVAIALAESWNPLIKSNNRARRMVIMTKVSKDDAP
ncbi:Uncharacterised protein [uncultured archaeon]|nr:Uncharacterised protein [uncultured archaeon]